MSGQVRSIAVPDTGGREVETEKIQLPDGTFVDRQVVEALVSDDIRRIKNLFEKVFVAWSAKNPIVMPGAQSLKRDDAGLLLTNDTASPEGGARNFKLLAAGTTNASLIKSTKGQVYGWHIHNLAAATRFVKLYNTNKKPVVGTDIPALTLGFPSGAAANVWMSTGLDEFYSGIGLATTVNVADSDATAVTASDLMINLFWV